MQHRGDLLDVEHGVAAVPRRSPELSSLAMPSSTLPPVIMMSSTTTTRSPASKSVTVSRGKNSRANVVFPAPLGPAMMMTRCSANQPPKHLQLPAKPFVKSYFHRPAH